MNTNLKLIREVSMGIIWFSFGVFWLVYNKLYPNANLEVLDENPAWIGFNVIALVYGVWRIFRAYHLYKREKDSNF